MYPPSNNNCPSLSSLFHIPSPSMQYEHELFFQSYHDHYLQQQQLPLIEDQSFVILADSTETATNPSNCTHSVKKLYSTEIVTSNLCPEGNEEKEGVEGRGNKGDDMMSRRIPKNKRSSNKDRHSKINTARGPRNRRMRLSLDAARKFFSLQDLLGFDKASKAVEWLLIKSESAIEELAKGNGGTMPHMNRRSCSTTAGIGASSISECEVMSGTSPGETSSNDKKETGKGGSTSNKEKKKKTNTARGAAFEPLTRESRDQARARARERTKIKKSLIGKSKANMASWRPFKDSNMNHSPYEIEELTSHQEKQLLGPKADDVHLVVNGNWNPFSIFN